MLIFSFVFTGCGNAADKDNTVSEEATSDNSSSVSADTSTTEATSFKTEITSAEEKSSSTVTEDSTTEKQTSEPTTESEKDTSSHSETTTSATTEKTIKDLWEHSKKTTKTTTSTKTTKTMTKVNKIDTSFFDDAVFVGDSITLGLRNYVTAERNKGNSCLGNAQFLTAGSMGYVNTGLKIGESESIHPKYKGKEVYIEDGIKQIGAKKVFIMLGLNDFCAYSLEKGMSNAESCIKKIVNKNPGIRIYVQSVTPTAKNSGRFNNDNIKNFNSGLKNLCSKNGWTYVDISSVMKDSNGNLISSYCSDLDGRAVHLTKPGCAAWVNYLYKLYC